MVGASVRAAAFSLLRAGYHVVAADLFADADLAKQCEVTQIASYPDDFADWLANTDCDAWIYTGALENYPELVDRLSELRPLWGHGGDKLRSVRDPMQLQAALTLAGLFFPETRPAVEAGPPAGAWLGKTGGGSCGSGVGVTEGVNFWQRQVNGIPLSAVFVGDQLLGITRQFVGEAWAGASSYKYCGSIAPWALPSIVAGQLKKLGTLLCKEFGLDHTYGVDLVCDGEQLWTIEVNPRYTAAIEIVEQAYGVSAFGTVDFEQPTTSFGKVILYAKNSLRVTAEMSALLLEHAGGLPRSQLAWPQLADIPVPGTAIEIGQPVLSIFANGETGGMVIERLQQRVREIEQQLYGVTLKCD